MILNQSFFPFPLLEPPEHKDSNQAQKYQIVPATIKVQSAWQM